MVEAEWSAADDRASRKRRIAARRFGMEVAQSDEHVFGLNAPVARECPFDAATHRAGSNRF